MSSSELVNITAPTQFLSKAHYENMYAQQAVVKPLDRPVLIVSGAATGQDNETYGWCLKSGIIGSWMTLDRVSGQAIMSAADDPVAIPKARVTQAMMASDTPAGIALLIEGRSGSAKVKMLVETTPERAATAMLHEVLNGFSVMMTLPYPLDAQDTAVLTSPRTPRRRHA